MKGATVGRGRDRDQGRDVEPGEARAHGNDPDAVQMNREGGRDEGQLGPNIDSEGRDMDQQRGGDGPRSVGRAREERGGSRDERSRGDSRDERSRDKGRSQEDTRRGDNEHGNADADRGTSWISVIFGLLAALGASLILSGIVGGIVGAILGLIGVGAATAGLIGVLVTLLVAFIIGGYVAGRMASRSGVKHGLFVPLLLLILTILLAIIGALVGFSLIDNLQGVTLPAVPSGVQQQAQQVQGAAPQNLGTILTISGILALIVPFIGGAIGGALGGKTGRNRP